MGLSRSKLPAHVRAAIDNATPAQLSEMLAVGQTPGVVELRLPYPPSANLYWRTRVIQPRGRPAFVSTYVSKEATEFKDLVALEARSKGVRPLLGEVEVEVMLYRPQKSGDLDNRLKCLLDSLRGIAYGDDASIVKIVAERHEDKHNPRVTVRVVQRAEDLFGGGT